MGLILFLGSFVVKTIIIEYWTMLSNVLKAEIIAEVAQNFWDDSYPHPTHSPSVYPTAAVGYAWHLKSDKVGKTDWIKLHFFWRGSMESIAIEIRESRNCKGISIETLSRG